MVRLRLLTFLLCSLSFISQGYSAQVEYELSYIPFSLNEYPRPGTDREHPWRLDELFFAGKGADLKGDCKQEQGTTICKGVVPEIHFQNYKGLAVRFAGYGILKLEFTVDGLSYLSKPIQASAVRKSTRLDYNHFVKSDSGNFPAEEGHRFYEFTEAPFIGGVIQHSQENQSIRLACTEFENEDCITFQIVKSTNGQFSLANYHTFSIKEAAEIKTSRPKVDLQGNWILPTTAVTSACGVPLLLPLTLPIDIVLMPITLPIAFAKKFHAQKALKSLFNLSLTETKKVRELNFQILEEIIENIKLEK
jgi:hypothetical protein